MGSAGQRIGFPSLDNIKWFWVTRPSGLKIDHGTDQMLWCPDREWQISTMPFDEQNGCIVRPYLLVEPQRCKNCGCV
ncbi:hypothetical protein F5B17DRAFT_403174, partial [Nemania serpens]